MQQLFHRLGDIDHVIWDWNGTLLNDVPHAVDTINFLLEPRGLPLMSVERYREIFSFPIRRYYETLGFDLQADSFADLCDQFIDRFMAKVGECPLAPGSRELLGQIKASGKKQSVLSATEQGNLHDMLSQFGLSHYFDFVFGIADRLAVSKVQRGHDLMRESGVPSTRTLLRPRGRVARVRKEVALEKSVGERLRACVAGSLAQSQLLHVSTLEQRKNSLDD